MGEGPRLTRGLPSESEKAVPFVCSSALVGLSDPQRNSVFRLANRARGRKARHTSINLSRSKVMPMVKQVCNNVARAILPDAVKHVVRLYRYRVSYMPSISRNQKMQILKESVRRSLVGRKNIFFYPDAPMPHCVIYKLLMFLGYRVTTDPQENCDLAIQYWHGFDGNPFSPAKSVPPVKTTRQDGIKILNIRCNDISKLRIAAVFDDIFGYSLSVDPRKHVGKCVMKLNWNALHKGQIIECPTEPREGDFVYQKLVRNEAADGFVKDMRVPIYGTRTPFVYLKYRSVTDRFIDRAHTNTKATIAEVSEVLSVNEVANIYRFCERLGLDYGELDVLRDRDDGRIYIVDANNAPSGPPSPISDDEEKVAVVRLAQAFEEAFGV